VNTLYTREDRLNFLHHYADQIDRAKSILVIGGGATGTEFLGEIQAAYGRDKKYGLINSQDQLLSGFPTSASAKALRHFENNITDVRLGKRYDPNSELSNDYEFKLMCVGLTHHTPFFDNDSFKQCKDKRGRIFVNEYFQVTNQDPEIESIEELKEHPVVYENIF